mmetsp:Transcript_47817/g.86172  ORF Transcript_47817/g.86172 Transcript_47817/m.86172 type:complete len:603 (-) Transcript_47817:135-1943(-)|eukprot:CAMPEP_0197657620 /NCGR_PEP_ID=MMETSP1338-20131121/44740_1 /TAXON_ID=43686 ORGANISM="Pelagodinium beii, Strain RCC1491" /NCGR_SAMPLE_ID=MMETSP1338 /ASSEMBLY_ACC=CAM_ASM_000754 /LENGTH=602 /DNA_ID=CAMNT_0043234035 /DNA_START=23 /DNA_END=1831 /DNA_ORIENTATION=+
MACFHSLESGSTRRLSAAWALVLLCQPADATGAGGLYEIQEQFVGTDFFSKWNFYTGGDPTHGTVEFVDYATAASRNLLSASADRVFMGADTTEVVTTGPGRKAIKILSKCQYDNGLFVLKVDHVPSSCGSWPAWWMFGEDSQHAWPRWGEYDILESVHNLTWSATTLHTRANCDQSKINTGLDFAGTGWGTGTAGQPTKNCFVSAANQYSNEGCGQKMPAGSFGPPLNEGGGGTYAAEWDPGEKHIRTWFFKAGQEPLDLQEKKPRPAFWGTPTSFFTLDPNYCSKGHFNNMRMVFDTTFCGDYGSATFSSACPLAGMSCDQFVRQRPKEFTEAYWSIKSLDVYQRANYKKFVCDGDLGSAPMAVAGGSSGMSWLLAGCVLSGLGMVMCWAVKVWPRQIQRKSRGLPPDTGTPAGDALASCLDVNIEQVQQGELVVSPPPDHRSTRSQVAQTGQPHSPPQQRNNQGFLQMYFAPPAQPATMRSMSNSQPPSPSRGGQQGLWSNWANPSPMGQPPISRTTSPSYIPQPVASGRHQRISSGGAWGFLQPVFGGAYDSARQPASPVGSFNSQQYASLPPTINALGSGHIPPQYQPVRGYERSGR